MFKRKYSVTILDENWGKIKEDLKVTFIPRQNEMIYLGIGKYLVVTEVIHYLINGKQGIFIIVRDYLGPILAEK